MFNVDAAQPSFRSEWKWRVINSERSGFKSRNITDPWLSSRYCDYKHNYGAIRVSSSRMVPWEPRRDEIKNVFRRSRVAHGQIVVSRPVRFVSTIFTGAIIECFGELTSLERRIYCLSPGEAWFHQFLIDRFSPRLLPRRRWIRATSRSDPPCSLRTCTKFSICTIRSCLSFFTSVRYVRSFDCDSWRYRGNNSQPVNLINDADITKRYNFLLRRNVCLCVIIFHRTFVIIFIATSLHLTHFTKFFMSEIISI